MRIAYLINQYPKISHSFIRREILALEQLGFDVMRISLRGWDLELVDEADLLERERTRFVLRSPLSELLVAVLRMGFKRPVRFFRALRISWNMSRRSTRRFYVHLAYLVEACCIEDWLREARVQHLHTHFGTNSAEVAMLVRTLGGPTWSLTVHGPEEFEHERELHLNDKIKNCTFATTVSMFGRAQLCRNLRPQFWDKIHVVHCGLDPDYATTPATVDVSPNRIVCVARLSPEKGHAVLLEAAEQLAAQGVDFQIVLAGDGEIRPQIEAEIAHNQLGEKIHIAGWLNQMQVRDLILGARALVLPSFAEGLPVVIMEAMALGRPVISTFVAGIPELVVPGENGWLVPASDVDSLVDAIRNCLEATRDAISELGQSARKQVLSRHDVNAEARKLQKLFRQATNDASSYSSRVA